jgi:hypothetical protein
MADLPQPFFARRRSNNGRVVIEVGGECDMATRPLRIRSSCSSRAG